MDNLLKLRDEHTDLHTVEVKFGEFWGDDEDCVSLWIRYALMCKVRSVTLHAQYTEYLYLNLDVASAHLRKVDLLGRDGARKKGHRCRATNAHYTIMKFEVQCNKTCRLYK